MPVFLKRRQPQVILPPGYTRTEYTEQYSDLFGRYGVTDYKPCALTEIICETDYKPTNDVTVLFGCRNENGSRPFAIASYQKKMRFDYDESTEYFGSVPSGRYTLHIKNRNVYINGELKATVGYSEFFELSRQNVTLYLFGCHEGTQYAAADPSPEGTKMWSFKIYEQGVLLRNYVPCIRDSDNMPGWYDTVNKTFVDL